MNPFTTYSLELLLFPSVLKINVIDIFAPLRLWLWNTTNRRITSIISYFGSQFYNYTFYFQFLCVIYQLIVVKIWILWGQVMSKTFMACDVNVKRTFKKGSLLYLITFNLFLSSFVVDLFHIYIPRDALIYHIGSNHF